MNQDCNCNARKCDCERVVSKNIEIDTPVSVEPTVKIGKIKQECGKPQICRTHGCEFIIKQTICVEIPICYDVGVDVGDSCTDC